MNLLQETGSYFISNSNSNYVTFSFKGDPQFINRMVNFCFNYGITTKSDSIVQYSGEHHYIYTPMDRLKKALLELFRGEIILEGNKNDIDYKVVTTITMDINNEECESIDITHNEEKLEELARERLKEFWSLITFENLQMNHERAMTYAEEYNIGGYQDAEPEFLTA